MHDLLPARHGPPGDGSSSAAPPADPRRAEDRYRDLADAMPLIVWIARPDGTPDYYNQPWWDYTGLPLGDRDRAWYRVVHPNDEQPARACWQAALRGEARYEIECRFRRYDGEYRWHLERANPIYDAAGAVLAWVGTATDIEDQKRAEADLRHLSESITLLSTSLDYETTLQRIAWLAVPEFAEWCFVDLVDQAGNFQRVAVAHADGAHESLADALRGAPPGITKWAAEVADLAAGEPQLITDLGPAFYRSVAPDPTHRALLHALGLHALLIVPLLAGARMLGAISFGGGAGRTYGPAQITTGRQIARQVALAVTNARLYQAAQDDIALRAGIEARLREETETLETLNHLGQVLAAELDLQRLVAAVTDAATSLTGANFGAFFYNLVDERGESYTRYTLSGVPRTAFEPFPIPRNTHLLGPTFVGEAPIRIADVQLDPRYGHNPPHFGMPAGHPPVVSYLAVPVIARSGEVLGSLYFGHADAGAFSARHERLVVGLAAQTAIAMDNARLYLQLHDAIREREQTIQHQQLLEQQLTLLVEASSNLLGTLELDQVLPTVVDVARRVVAADAYAVWQYQPRDAHWRAVCSAGLSPAYQRTTEQNYGTTLPFTAIIQAEDVETSPALATRVAGYQQEGIRSVLAVPLWIHGTVSGSITFYWRRPRHFTEMEVRVASALANIAGSAIGSADLYETQRRLRTAAQQAQARSDFLAEVSQVLAGSLDYETTLHSLVKLVVPRLADWCAIDLPDEQGGLVPFAVAHGDSARMALALELRRRYPTDMDSAQGLAAVLHTRQGAMVPEITDEMLVAGAKDPEHLALMRGLGLHSILYVPLVARGHALGVLTLAHSESGRVYTAADLELAEEIARRAGIAVDNAQLYRDAQEAIRVRDEFLSIASHELKTPLTGLQLQVQMLLHLAKKDHLAGLPAERLVMMLERSERQSKQIVKLINTLLDVSRLAAGRIELDREPVDLAEVTRTVAESFGVELAAARVPLTLTAAMPVVGEWDRARLEQVVTNLLGNALKYGLGRPIELTVEPGDGTGRLIVRDYGIGIAADQQARIFERFERAVEAHNYGGFGLGLYIVRQIVDALGGTITVTSAPEVGSAFVVALPLAGPPGAGMRAEPSG
ncbi:MAG TPA: GAF domain-containing protein [Chloroflexia bacterium]|nr:GAF domain-containing protein [Chloroflexia bacterium]